MADRKGDFAGGGPKGKKGFPMNDAKHQRLAIGGATRSYNAGNISKSKEQAIKAEARHKLGEGKSVSKSKGPRGARPSEDLQKQGHFKSHRAQSDAAEMSHSEFQGLQHGGAYDHAKGRGKGVGGC